MRARNLLTRDEVTTLPGSRAHPLVDFLRELPGPGKRFWALVLLTGTAAGLGAVVLVWLLRAVETISWPPRATFLDAVSAASPYRTMAVLLTAGLIVVLASLAYRHPLGGHGTAGVLEAIWFKSGRIPLVRTLVRGFISIVAVAMGAPLGREGALLQFGSAFGSKLAQKVKVTPDQVRLLVACGASAGIAAAYNVPIGAALFGLEVLLGSFALELFGPIVVACVVATVISRVLIADHPTYVIPHRAMMHPAELLVELALGPLFGLASAIYNRTLNGFAQTFESLPIKVRMALPIPVMGLVGLAAIWMPGILGNGYDVVNLALLGRLPLALLILLPLTKLLGTALTSASGVPGGLFTPSLFFGALIGGALGHGVTALFPHLGPPEAFALIGMSAVLAGTTHASVSAVLIIFELTGSYEVILPLMVTSVSAAAVSRWIEPDSLYTAVLRRRKVRVPEALRPEWLRGISVRALMSNDADDVGAAAPFNDVVVRLLELPPGRDLYVVDSKGCLQGVIILDELKGHLPDHALLQMTIAADLMNGVEPLTTDMSVAEVSHRFSETDAERLPVVDRQRRLIGTVAKRDVLRHVRF